MSFKPATHLLLYTLATGGTVFYSFVATPSAFKHLEKDQFSRLQNLVFPNMFFMQTVAPLAIIATAPVPIANHAKLALAFASVAGLANYSYLQPHASKIKQEGKSAVTKEEKDRVIQRFKKVHGLSLVSNFAFTGSMLYYGLKLAKRIH